MPNTHAVLDSINIMLSAAPRGIKEIQKHIVESAKTFKPQEPRPQFGDCPTVYGGGYVLTPAAEKKLGEVDPAVVAL